MPYILQENRGITKEEIEEQSGPGMTFEEI